MINLIDSILNGIVEIITALFEFIGDLFADMFTKAKVNEYTAEFGDPYYQLQRKGSGFRIGYKWGNSLVDSHSHLICLGGSGSKKSSCISFPTLLQSHDSSYVVFDCSRELFSGTAAYLNSKGYDVFLFDYDDYSHSIGFNGLAKCTTETDVFRLAQVLVKNSLEGASYDYWAQSAEQIIGFFSYILFRYADKAFVNYPNVLNMIQVFSFAPDQIDAWILKVGCEQRIVNKYKALLATPQKTLQCSIATATNALAIYNNPNIAAITSQDTLAFEQFRNKKSVLYICGSPSMTQYCRGISASFFESFFSHILNKLPLKTALPITFLIDEASTMRLESLPKILELGRKYSISVATLWQDFGQVEHIFGKHQASNILANSKVKVYMPSGQPLATCRMLEELLGRYSYEDLAGGMRSRELLNAQEIFQLKQILLLNGNEKPLLLEPKPYFLNPKLKRFTELPVFQPANTLLSTDPPLLQFED